MKFVWLLLALCMCFPTCHFQNTPGDGTSGCGAEATTNQLLTTLLAQNSDILSRLSAAERKLAQAERKLAQAESKLAVSQNDKRELLEKVEDLQINFTKNTGHKVAFYVQRSTSMGPVLRWTTVKFDQVRLNHGVRFNALSSHFQADVKGVYQFSFASIGDGGHQSSCRIVKNGNVIMTSNGSVNDWGQAVALATIQLDVGDEVWVELRPSSFVLHENQGFRLSAFSGNLLFTT